MQPTDGKPGDSGDEMLPPVPLVDPAAGVPTSHVDADVARADIKRKVFRGISALYTVQLVSLPLSMVTNLLAGRLLEPVNYGSFATAIFAVTVVSMASELGLMQTLMRHPSRLETRDYAAAFTYQAGSAVVIALFLLVGAPAVGWFTGDAGEIVPMIRLLALLPILNSFLTVPLVKAERELHYGGLAWASGICTILERFVLLGLMLAGLRGYSYAWARIAGVVLQAGSFYLITRWSAIELIREILARGWRGREMLRFGAWVQLKACANPIGESVVPALAGNLFGSGTVGLLTWSNGVASLVGLRLPQVSARVLISAANQYNQAAAGTGSAEIAAERPVADEYRAQFEKILLVSTCLIGTLLAVLAATMPELLAFFFKPQWRDAAPYFQIACLNMGLGVLLTFYDALVVVRGFPEIAALASWTWALVAFSGAWIFARLMGPAGILWGQIASTAAPTLLLHLKIRRTAPIEVFRNFFVPMALSFGLWALTGALKPRVVNGLPSLLAFGTVMGCVGLAVQVLTHPKLPMIVRNLLRDRGGAVLRRS